MYSSRLSFPSSRPATELWYERDHRPCPDCIRCAGRSGGVLVSGRGAQTGPNDTDAAALGPEIEIRSVTIDGLTLRYVATGEGPSLLLLHTLRTQLDMFQRTVHALAQTFRVYAVDLPGHGYFIPETDLEPELFVRTVGGFLDEPRLEDVVVVGESIGATIGLLLAARGHPRVKRVVATDPYDYDRGRGTRKSLGQGNVVLAAGLPLIGGTVMRFRTQLSRTRPSSVVFDAGRRSRPACWRS